MIRKEEPPYEFKILLFLDKNERDDEGAERAEAGSSTRELTLKVMAKLADFDATNVRDSVGKQPGRQDRVGARIRYTFQIEDREKALACFKFFQDFE